MKKLVISFLLIALAGYTSANNENEKMYVSAGISNVTVDLGITTSTGVTVDDEDTAPMVLIGYKLDDNLALEAGMIGAADVSVTVGGSFSGTYLGKSISASVAVSAIAEAQESYMFGVAHHTEINDNLNITARAGMLMWDVDYYVSASGNVTYDGSVYSGSARAKIAEDDGSDAYFGVGADYKITDDITAEASYLTTEIAGDDTSALTFGIKHKF